MNRNLGGLIMLVGLVGVVYYGIQYSQNSASFNFFGSEVLISSGEIAPVLISAVLLVIGIVLYQSKRAR